MICSRRRSPSLVSSSACCSSPSMWSRSRCRYGKPHPSSSRIWWSATGAGAEWTRTVSPKDTKVIVKKKIQNQAHGYKACAYQAHRYKAYVHKPHEYRENAPQRSRVQSSRVQDIRVQSSRVLNTHCKAHKFTAHGYNAYVLKRNEHDAPSCTVSPSVNAAGPQGQCRGEERSHDAGRGTVKSSSYGVCASCQLFGMLSIVLTLFPPIRLPPPPSPPPLLHPFLLVLPSQLPFHSPSRTSKP